MVKIGGYVFESLDLKMIRERYDEEVKKGRLIREEFYNIVDLLRNDGGGIQHIPGADSTTSESNTIANIKGRTSLRKMLGFLRELPGFCPPCTGFMHGHGASGRCCCSLGL